MRGRRTRGGRRGNRFSNPSPAAAASTSPAPNQFQRDDSVPAGSVPPTTATTPPAGTTPINVSMPSNATPAGTVNTNPSGVSMPGTMMNAGIPPASTPAAGIQGQTGLDRPLASQQPPNQQMGPNNPMGAELPAAGAGVNTNPTNSPIVQPQRPKPLFQNSRLSPMGKFYMGGTR